jgi:hypothetical protein
MTTTSTASQSIQGLLNAGRMLSDGIPYYDLQRATEEVTDLQDWFDFWVAAGER